MDQQSSSFQGSDQSLVERFPLITHLLGRNWLGNHPDWPSSGKPFQWWSPWLGQLEEDLAILSQKFTFNEVNRQYKTLLRDHSKLMQSVYEIHGAALLCPVSSDLMVHVARHPDSNTNFDYKAKVHGVIVNVETKTRDDNFLIPRNRIINDDGEYAGYFVERETIDPHDAPALNARAGQKAPGSQYQATPESTVLRQVLLEALSQLPEDGVNIVFLAHLQGERKDLERALFGTEFCRLTRDHSNKTYTPEWRLSPTGAFRPDEKGEPFRRLSAVLWFRLSSLGGPVARAYNLYPNPYASSLMPASVQDALQRSINHLARDFS